MILPLGTHIKELECRQEGVSYVISHPKIGDLVRYNSEKNRTMYLDDLKNLNESEYQQLEADCIAYIMENLVNQK